MKLLRRKDAPQPRPIEELAPTAEIAVPVHRNHAREGVDVGALPEPIQCAHCGQWYLKPTCNLETRGDCQNYKHVLKKRNLPAPKVRES